MAEADILQRWRMVSFRGRANIHRIQ